MAIAAEGFFVFRFFAVQLGTGEQHRANAMHMRAVRVFSLLALGVVLTVNGRLLFGHLTGGHPQPKTEEMRCDGVQIQGTVRLMAVQEDGHAGNSDVGEAQNDKENLPTRKSHDSVCHPVNDRVKYSRVE